MTQKEIVNEIKGILRLLPEHEVDESTANFIIQKAREYLNDILIGLREKDYLDYDELLEDPCYDELEELDSVNSCG